jgi:hypothetical protein
MEWISTMRETCALGAGGSGAQILILIWSLRFPWRPFSERFSKTFST